MQKTLVKTHIKEIFTSIQGEGIYVGEKQIFVRFCKCNLKCKFCDTDFDIKNAKTYSTKDLFDILKKNPAKTVSFTGGEPLSEVDFLYELLTKYPLDKKIYLETNGICHKELSKVIDFIDTVSMDIKLQSTAKQPNRFSDNEKFLEEANKNNKEIFIKVIFDNNIKNEEINKVIDIAQKYGTLIVLQPKMPMDENLDIEKIFDKFYSKYQNVRLIPQVHKFLNLI